MSIVCGTDFSGNSAQACEAAAAIAARKKEPLELIHVIEGLDPGVVIESLQQSYDAAARKQLDAEAARLRKLGATVREQLLHGVPDEEIVAYAGKSGASLLVVSSLGRRTPSRWLLGGTAERTAQISKVPVLVVRDSAPFLAWVRGERPLRVLAAAAFSDTADAAMRWLAEFRRLGKCELIVGHVYWPVEEHARLGVRRPMHIFENDPEIESVLRRDLAARIGGVSGESETLIRIEAGLGSTAHHLISMAEEEGADLVVVGSHQRRGLSRLWHGSVSRGVLGHAPMSVACVPLAAGVDGEALPVPRMRKVLATTDFSDLGNRAIPYAYAAAEPGGAVHLAHVIEPLTLPNPLYAHYTEGRMPTPEERARQIEEIVSRLRALVPREADGRGIRTEVEVFESNEVARGICALAERLDADLLCIASHGRSGLSRAIAGSVAQEVMSRVRRPILVVRPPRDS